jgi:hypothetical protein
MKLGMNFQKGGLSMNYNSNQRIIVKRWIEDAVDARVRDSTRGMYPSARLSREQARKRIERQIEQRYKENNDI